MEKYSGLLQYSKTMSEVKLIRWNDLPRFPIYADQLLQIVQDELSFIQVGGENLITKSMVNNYVKWEMMPKPVKKKYEKLHIVSVIVITILKQVLPITKIKDGIKLQIALQGNEGAYDSFCEALEESMQLTFLPILKGQNPYVLEERKIEYENLAISSITMALSNKLITEKIIEIRNKSYLNQINYSKEVEKNE
jgi:hypothetical protein